MTFFTNSHDQLHCFYWIVLALIVVVGSFPCSFFWICIWFISRVLEIEAHAESIVRTVRHLPSYECNIVCLLNIGITIKVKQKSHNYITLELFFSALSILCTNKISYRKKCTEKKQQTLAHQNHTTRWVHNENERQQRHRIKQKDANEKLHNCIRLYAMIHIVVPFCVWEFHIDRR